MSRGKYIGLALLSLSFWLSACGSNSGGIGEILGLNRRPPDEFLVIARPPLTLPPDFTLSPSARESTPEAQTSVRQVIFGSGTGDATVEPLQALEQDVSQSEYYVLQQTGAIGSDEGIRSTVDLESAQLKEEDANFIRQFLGTEPEFGTALDAQEEYDRLQEQGDTQ